jgi:hypothetical protein
MHEIYASGVLVDQREGGTGDMAFGGNAQALGQPLHEGGFAGSERPTQGNDVAHHEQATEACPQTMHAVGAVDAKR